MMYLNLKVLFFCHIEREISRGFTCFLLFEEIFRRSLLKMTVAFSVILSAAKYLVVLPAFFFSRRSFIARFSR